MPQNGAKAGVFEPSQAQPLIGANVKRVAGSRFDTVCDLIQSGAQDGPFLGRRQPLGLSCCCTVAKHHQAPTLRGRHTSGVLR